jgi:hypothetical protein
MSQTEENVTLEEPTEQVTWRTPGRKLTKEDLSATSVLLMGCTCQECCDPAGTGPSGDVPFTEVTL